jgi:hypothetical protein
MNQSGNSATSSYGSPFFWKTVLLFGVVWTFAPLLFLPNYWLDTIEQIFVGKEWVLSTQKHPALTAIILHTFRSILKNAPFAPYLLSQIMMGTVLWTVWRLGRLFLDPPRAAAALFVMLNYYWMNFGSVDYNNNVTLIFAWGLSFYFGLMALRTDRLRDWIGLGIAVGIGLHLKYTEILFPTSLIIFLAWSKMRRRYFCSGRFWLAVAIAFLIFLPQTLWILNGNLRTLQYALTLERDENPAICHLVCPLHFTFSQTAYWGLSLLWLTPLFLGNADKKKSFHRYTTPLSMEESYLLWMTFLPFLIQVVYAAVSAHYVRFSLGCHLWIYIPIILLRFLPIRQDNTALKRTLFQNASLAVLVLLSSVAVTLLYPRITGRCSRYLFPGRALADRVEEAWHSRYDTPIPWAAGEWWLAGNLAVYGKDNPRVLYSREPDQFCGPWLVTTWGTYDDLRQQGGVLLWEIRESEPEVPNRLNELFPEAKREADIYLNGLLTADKVRFRFGMATIPPDEKGSPRHKHKNFALGNLKQKEIFVAKPRKSY